MIRSSARLASKQYDKCFTPLMEIKEERPESPPAPAEMNQQLLSQKSSQHHHQTPSSKIINKNYMNPRFGSSGKKRPSGQRTLNHTNHNNNKKIGPNNHSMVTSESSMDEMDEPMNDSMEDEDDFLHRKHMTPWNRNNDSYEELNSARQKLTHVLSHISKRDGNNDCDSEDGYREHIEMKKMRSKSPKKYFMLILNCA